MKRSVAAAAATTTLASPKRLSYRDVFLNSAELTPRPSEFRGGFLQELVPPQGTSGDVFFGEILAYREGFSTNFRLKCFRAKICRPSLLEWHLNCVNGAYGFFL